jgi:ataxin-3
MNSFLTQGPEWISPTYLRLVLIQAEKEGYSVFVVRRASGNQLKEGEGWNDGGVGALPECEADRIAVALGEPSGRGKESTGPGPSTASSESRLIMSLSRR